jgi:hypothetical protein
MPDCSAQKIALPQGIDAYRIGNDHVAVTILPEKGADITGWVHKPSGVDVLWKSPWGLRRHRGNTTSSTNTSVAWLDGYQGGWQILFPSGGGPCTYKGVELNFHGEASVAAWDVEEFGASTDGAGIRLTTRLARSPFRISREIHLGPADAHFMLKETIQNDGGEPVDYMWGHHPAYGPPFLSDRTIIDTNARKITADDQLDGPGNPLEPGQTYDWPAGSRQGVAADLSHIPAPGSGIATLAYLHDFADETAWYGFTNTERGVGAGLAWRRDDFPCAWFWQELNASPGYPWYKGFYVMAIEPNTSYPGQGLVAVMEKTGMHRTLQPGETASVAMTAVLYASTTGIAGIGMDGRVTMKEQLR